tara:strand:+ start:1523 stop:2494 length:972 start_codon:yes stop_codon:yes gene_type:complete
MSSFNLSTRVKLVNPSSDVDFQYGPYATVAAANIAVIQGLRGKGRTVAILEGGAAVEYHWKSGVTDADLVVKNPISSKPNTAQPANPGIQSTGNTASGARSVAIGGTGAVASGIGAIAIGKDSVSSGGPVSPPVAGSSEGDSIAIGFEAEATSTTSIAIGFETTATDQNAVCIGSTSSASGENAVAIGRGLSSSGTSSFTAGQANQALGSFSVSLGGGATSKAFASTAIGRFNVASTPTGSTPAEQAQFNLLNEAFIIGNGDYNAQGVRVDSNCFVVLFNGNTTANGDIKCGPNGKGFILQAPNGQYKRIEVDNNGVLSTQNA